MNNEPWALVEPAVFLLFQKKGLYHFHFQERKERKDK